MSSVTHISEVMPVLTRIHLSCEVNESDEYRTFPNTSLIVNTQLTAGVESNQDALFT